MTAAGRSTSTIPSAIKDEGQSFWNANPCGGDWHSYAAFMEWTQRTEPYAFELLARREWKGVRVLDVGCGQGTILNFLPTLGARVVGIDRSLVSMQKSAHGARELGHEGAVHLAIADAETLPFPDEAFERVVSFGVLHHTPDTAGGIREIHRVLKAGGSAHLMLYRRGNPKWWATQCSRTIARAVEAAAGRTGAVTDALRARQDPGSARGTALLELFGVPVLKAFTNREARALFADFARVEISNHQPGFRRLMDIVPVLAPLRAPLAWVDRVTRVRWGFYQVIEAFK